MLFVIEDNPVASRPRHRALFEQRIWSHKNIKETGKEQATHGTWSEICCETYERNARVERFDLNLCSNKVPILNTYM